MPGTDLAPIDQAVALLESDDFVARIEPLLPDTVPLRRFVQVAKTAIRSNPDLTDSRIDQRTLFNSLIRCAQDGLYPDNKEAALVPYKGKVNYLKMIDGVRKVAAEYGWTLRTRVVYANDEFDFSEEPPTLIHRPVRPGMERGQRIAAYAIATHRDGRRLQRVMYPEEIAKRRAKAQTQAVWNEWEDAMWSKSVGHAIFAELPKSERDLLVRLVSADDTDPAAAAELLYGPDGSRFTATPALSPPADATNGHAPPADKPKGDEHTADGGGQQTDRGGSQGDGGRADASSAPAAAVPGDDDEEPQPPGREDELAAAAQVVAGTVVPNGGWKGMTLAQVHDAGEEGVKWLGYALKHRSKFDDAFVAALETYVQGAVPALWAEHEAKAAA